MKKVNLCLLTFFVLLLFSMVFQAQKCLENSKPATFNSSTANNIPACVNNQVSLGFQCILWVLAVQVNIILQRRKKANHF